MIDQALAATDEVIKHDKRAHQQVPFQKKIATSYITTCTQNFSNSNWNKFCLSYHAFLMYAYANHHNPAFCSLFILNQAFTKTRKSNYCLIHHFGLQDEIRLRSSLTSLT